MSIEWFPGHMLAARKEAAESMRKTDVVIELLDARVPHSSCNPTVETLRRQCSRPALKLLNMSDLADPDRTRLWLQHYNKQAVAISCKSPGDVKKVPEYCLSLAPHRGTAGKQLRMMILGIPNVGKSSLMNALLKRSIAKAGNEPGVTKLQKRHQLGPNMSLIDTPGLLWPRIDQQSALKLAASHSIGRNAYVDEDVALDLGGYLLADYPALIALRYGAPPEGCDAHGLLEWIARRRGFLLKGGVLDIATAAAALLHDFRVGALGRITLETPLQITGE
jgi:ribosome biogenesis GTPase A